MKLTRHQLFEAIMTGALVLTANRRLFRHLREGYDLWIQAQGKQVWPTPKIFSYEGWLTAELGKLGELTQLLSPYQERCLWEELIATSAKGSALELLQLSKTAEKAVQAHHLAVEYQLELVESSLTLDQRMFLSWQNSFREYCRQHDLFDKSAVAGKICQAVTDSQIVLPDQLFLVGFDQLSPGVVQLQQAASERGCECNEVELIVTQAGEIVRFSALDKNDEIESAARWTRNLLEQGADSIGIVVPDLVRQRRKIERVFRDQIDPEAALTAGNDDALFSLSLGGPLADQGVIFAALEILACGHYLTIDQVSFLLRTPYLSGSRKESDSRAMFDRQLRSYQQQRYRLSGLISLTANKPGIKGFGEILKGLRTELERQKKKPGQWAQSFAEQLKDLGWPGDRTISSGEFQALKSWRVNVVEVMPTLDRILSEMDRNQAMTLLRRMTQDTDFQLESPGGQVQVIGLLESSGLSFQHLWVMGLEDRVFPAQPQPNPFLPYQLQRDHQMPRASAEREYLFAEQVVERLKTSSPDVVFSYPQREGDSFLRPSPLLTSLGQEGVLALAPCADPLHASGTDPGAIDVIDDRQGAAIGSASARGGTSLLKDQAHCPFRAYVHHRLQCRALDEAAAGIAAPVRGDLIHLALEYLWQQLKDQTQLLALSDAERQKLIQTQVERALTDYYQARTSPPATLLVLESERLESLLDDWLTGIEMKRDHFSVIATEKELETDIGPLVVKLKVDRIDQLEDGQRLVIDYKTSRNLKADDFLTQPLIEPQLPIYAISSQSEPADGITFAQLRKGACRFVGLVSHKGLLGRVKDLGSFSKAQDLGLSDWSQLLTFWQREAQQLADDFAAGKAAVKPFSQEESCRYCDLPGICRIDEVVCVRGEENE